MFSSLSVYLSKHMLFFLVDGFIMLSVLHLVYLFGFLFNYFI